LIRSQRFCKARPTLFVSAFNLSTGRQIMYCANVLGEEKIKRPVKGHTNLLVQPGQLAQVNRSPEPPREEARKIQSKDPRHSRPSAE
jgi:hypothetical protein